jgi:hypothetical protein
MRKALLLCGLLVAAPVVFWAAPAGAQQSWMVGRWYGYGQPNDKSQMWIGMASADGKFHVLHRQCILGKAIDHTNDGAWSLEGDIFTIRIDKVDGEAVPRTDVYRVLSHSETRQTYRHEASGFVYNSRKVDGKFQMPPCDLAS